MTTTANCIDCKKSVRKTTEGSGETCDMGLMKTKQD